LFVAPLSQRGTFRGKSRRENPKAGMRNRPLLTFRDVVIKGDGGHTLGPINWTVYRAERIRLETEVPEVSHALFLVLAGLAVPASGYIEELSTVVVQADFLLQASISGNATIQEYLHSADAPEFVRLKGRRRAPGILLDKLGLLPRYFRRPLKLQPEEVRRRYWAFRFLVSRADLLLGGEIFEPGDEKVRDALRMRWADFPAAVVAACPEELMPGEFHTEVRLDRQGRFSRISLRAEPP
jgi:hypothetical protein